MSSQIKHEQSCIELRELIKSEIGLSQEKFANDYFRYVSGVNDIDESILKAHFERFKSRIKNGSDPRSPEIISSYLRFFKDTYCKDGTHTPSDRDAAWSMYVELDTRIATKEFLKGDIKSALSSLAALFNLHRNISKENGHRCRRYYELTNFHLDEYLRPFVSKYHESSIGVQPIDRESFKKELINVQKKLAILKNHLLKIAR